MKKLINLTQNQDGSFEYTLSEEAKKCEFLQFLINVSNFSWRKDPENVTNEDIQKNNLHFVSKLCAIGHLLQPLKDEKNVRAVVAINGSPDFQGRNGKSLFGDIITWAVSSLKISGRLENIMENKFIWHFVSENTKLVYINELSPLFDPCSLFEYITGDWVIHKKGMKSNYLPYQASPRLLITKDEPFDDRSISAERRLWYICFSDFYNHEHHPLDDFPIPFLDAWDSYQKRAINKLLVECMQLFLELGEIIVPLENYPLKPRIKLALGENFVNWAEEYFTEENLNRKLARKELYDDYYYVSDILISSVEFKQKLTHYCEFKGYSFTSKRSGGVEWFTVETKKSDV